MEKELRRVTFHMNDVNGSKGTIGDFEDEPQHGEYYLKKREGLFHCWGNEPFWDSETSQWRDHMCGIVEEIKTGNVFQVTPKNIQFIDNKSV